MEGEVVALCEFIFACDSADYIEDILVLLNSYLHRTPTITPALWFYYQIVIYNITGIPQPLWPQIPSLPLTDQQKSILTTLKNSQNSDMI